MLQCILSLVSWVLASMMTESSSCFWNVTETQDADVCMMVCLKCLVDLLFLSTPTIGSLWTQWAVMAASHCYSWWRWWSDTLLVTLIRLWPRHSCHMSFGFVNRKNDNFRVVLWSFLHNLIDMVVLQQRWKEKFFVNVGTDCGLTIAGFYYVCFSRSDGSVHGFYYDPNSRFALLFSCL